MTPTLNAIDLLLAQRVAAVVCGHGLKFDLSTVGGQHELLTLEALHVMIWGEHRRGETAMAQIREILGEAGFNRPAEAWAWIEYQRCQWWRLMGMASRPWGDEDGA